MVSAYERNSGRGPTDEQLSCSLLKEREIHEVLDFDITAFAASRDENVNITWKNRNKLFFQVYFNERVEENGKEGREEQFITGRIGGVTVIR